MKNKAEIMQQIEFVKINCNKFVSDLEILYVEVNDMKYSFSQNKKRATVNNRIQTLRNDLLELRKELYRQ